MRPFRDETDSFQQSNPSRNIYTSPENPNPTVPLFRTGKGLGDRLLIGNKRFDNRWIR